MHEHFVLWLEMTEVVKHVVGGHVGDRCRGCCLQRNSVGQRNHAVHGRENKAGLPAVAHGGHDLLPHLEPSNAFAECINHAADLVTRRKRERGPWLVEAKSHEQVSKIDAGIGDFDSNLAGFRSRRLHRFGGDGGDATGFLDDDTNARRHEVTLHVPLDCVTAPSASSDIRCERVWSTARPGWASGVSA